MKKSSGRTGVSIGRPMDNTSLTTGLMNLRCGSLVCPCMGASIPTLTRSNTRRLGEINSEVSIHAVDVDAQRTMELAKVDGDNYIPRIMWMGNTRT